MICGANHHKQSNHFQTICRDVGFCRPLSLSVDQDKLRLWHTFLQFTDSGHSYCSSYIQMPLQDNVSRFAHPSRKQLNNIHYIRKAKYDIIYFHLNYY